MFEKVLVTGARGFVGRAVTKVLRDGGCAVRAASRSTGSAWPDGVEAVQVEDLFTADGWSSAVRGVDTVIHCAARVHVMRDRSVNPLAEFRQANVKGILALADAAHQAGVRGFDFVSSVKVNGETTRMNHPFTVDNPAAPMDAYGVSKHEAGQALRHLAAQTGMEVVIIRPVLVYCPGVKGNFLSMMRWLQRGIPLLLGAVNNKLFRESSLLFLQA